MGPAYSHLNVWAMSTIASAQSPDLLQALETLESAYRHKNQPAVTKVEQESSDVHLSTQETLTPVDYTISEEAFVQLLKELQFSTSDSDILLNIFHIIDTRGFRAIDIRDALISFSVLTARSVYDAFEVAMRLMEREGNNILDKRQLVQVFKLMNATFKYCGDKHLQMDQVQDLADSLYTSIGRIDGTIFYPHYIEYLVSHPIVEMFLSVQFQGTAKDKLLTDEEIDARIDEK